MLTMRSGALRTTIHARMTANLREAVALYLDGENLAALGFAVDPTILVTLELAPTHA